MPIVDPHFTMPGADMPPQEFRDLKTQQGQINWLAQFACKINNSFEGQWNATAESLPYTDDATINITPSEDGLTFNFGIPRGAPYDDQVAFAFDTVAQMQENADQLGDGMLIMTAGFYAVGDGGGALYRISDSGTANGMDVIECGSLRAILCVSNSTVNALKLGIKNDGTEDISTIFNDMTGKYIIYFPVGIYKTEHTLYPRKSIYGFNYHRFDWSQEPVSNASCIVSAIEDANSDPAIIYINTPNVDACKLYLICNSTEFGIIHASTGIEHYLNDITIVKVKTTGIRIEPPNGRSRYIYINNISILGDVNYPDSIGITTNYNAYDSRIENIEIMRVKRGMILQSSFFGGNFHIWGGSYLNSTTPSQNWKNASQGLSVERSCLFYNVYLDTFNRYINVLNGDTVLNITNFYCMDDNTVDWNGYILNNNNGIINITNGEIRLINHLNGISDRFEPKLNLNKVAIRSDKENIFNEAYIRRFPELNGCYKITLPSTNIDYTPIAVIACSNQGNNDLTIQFFEMTIKINVEYAGSTVTVTGIENESAATFGYVYHPTSRLLVIYVKYNSTGSTQRPLVISSVQTGYTFTIDHKQLTQGITDILYASETEMPENYTAINFS